MEEQGGNQNNNNLSNKIKDKAKQKTKKQGKKIIRLALTKIATVGFAILTQIWPIILVLCTIGGLFDYIVDIVTAESTPEHIISQLEVEDVADLIQIKEDGQGGYYLDFVDDFDSKADAIVEDINSTTDAHNLPKDSEFLKKIIKAEVITQFPDLGGTPQGEGFQGSIKIRRVSPDKDIGEVKNTGAEDAVPIQEEVAYDTTQVGSYDETIKNWQAGKKLLIRANAKVYKQTESELNPGSDTGNWEEVLDQTGRVKTISRGTEVEYTGTYKNNENPLSGEVITYVEVKYENENVFVRANYLSERQEDTNEESNRKTTAVAKVTSRAGETGKEEVGGTKDSYVVAIAAGHNNTDDTGARSGDLVEEDLTVEVAQKVQELIEDRYSNIKVVQTGSTPNNRGNIGAGERTELAKNANPDLCIQIHFNSDTSADTNGVEVVYKQGDGISQQLAEILSDSISEAMGLGNRGAGPDTERCDTGSLGIIENAATSGFPSVVTEGGFLSGNVDASVIRNGGVDKYAEGIVDGIKEYLETDHSGYSSSEITNETVSEGVNSIVKNLKYVPQETMEQYISEGNTEALNVFTLDKDRNLITATWSYTGGTIELKENSSIDLKSTLEKYVMPYEYLLFFYIDTDYTGFSEDLADEIIEDTEIVMTLEDNVTTTQTTTTLQERREDEKEGSSYGWRDTNSVTTEVTESCNTSIGITYVNTWCVRAYQENSYSSEILNMGDNETKRLTIKGKVNDSEAGELTNEYVAKKDSYKETVVTGHDEQGMPITKEITYNYTIYNRNKINTRTISNSYEAGDLKTEGKENVFVDLYNAHNMYKRVRTDWIFKILENNERTANLLDLTKYLMYKATNIDYGVIEFDFSIFGLEQFQQINGESGGLDLLVEYIHHWEHSTPPPTNADGTKYIIENDGAGNAVVGYGVDIFNGGFADEFRAAGQPTSIGSEVDKEFVDGLEKQEIQNCLDSVRAKTSGLNLKEYQIYALVSRAYNCGVAGALTTSRGSPSMNFVNSYKAYWKEEDDQFEEKNPNANFNHSLYTQYMSKPVTASGYGYMAGLETRRRSEWTLFQTGYFDVLDKWYSEGGDLLSAADELHTAQQSWSYSTGGGLYWNNIEKSINNPSKVTCCATYVASVLYKAGYFTEAEINSFNYNYAPALYSFLQNKGWQTITSYSELQAGDIVFLSYGPGRISHVQIYAGDGLWYNAGSTDAIQRANPYNQGNFARNNFYAALRPN